MPPNILSGAKAGICLSTHAIYWKDFGGDVGYATYNGMEKTKINKDGDLEINGEWRNFNNQKIKIIPIPASACNSDSDIMKNFKKTIDEIIAYLKS
jgi:hypothetical protein